MRQVLIFVIPSFRRGGVERVTLNIINSLDIELFDIHLLICNGGDNHMLSYLKDGITIKELFKPSVRKSVPLIYKYLKNNKADIVFSSFGHVSLLLLVFKKIFRLKYEVVVRFNTLPSNNLQSNKRGSLYDVPFRYFLKYAKYIISQSDEMKVDILKHYLVQDSQVTTIRNLVDIDSIQKLSLVEVDDKISDDNAFVIISVGSLDEVKGFDLLIESVFLLKRGGTKNIKLYIIGDNREKGSNYSDVLNELIIRYELESQVKLLGLKVNPYPYIKQADAFVLSSRKEGFPNVILEALALSKPCVATNCVDFTGIIKEGENGIVIEKNDVVALAKGIKSIMSLDSSKFKSLQLNQFDYNEWFVKMQSK